MQSLPDAFFRKQLDLPIHLRGIQHGNCKSYCKKTRTSRQSEIGRGSCSGKHYLLGQLFRMLGLKVRHIICTHRFNESPLAFPEDMQEGDFIYIANAGAYTTAYASNFNGFPLPEVRVI